MECRVFILVFAALVLVPFSKGEEWRPPGSCQSCYYPEFTLIKKDGDFEERKYSATRWITTKTSDLSMSELKAAKDRLMNYCSDVAEACEILKNAWPALVTITEGEDGSESMSVSWFVPPNLTLPEDHDNDSEVKQEIRPAGTVYVKVFNGMPSAELAQDNANQLRDHLETAMKSYEPKKYTGAAYNSYFSVFHHNEIWIRAAM